jgi:hypothetical protein
VQNLIAYFSLHLFHRADHHSGYRRNSHGNY